MVQEADGAGAVLQSRSFFSTEKDCGRLRLEHFTGKTVCDQILERFALNSSEGAAPAGQPTHSYDEVGTTVLLAGSDRNHSDPSPTIKP